MQKTQSKKKLTVILAMALVVIMALGGTLAYLATITEQKNNSFSFAENIKARLDEPNWKPGEGENITPGYEIWKDPILTNTSNNGVEEYVAIRVNFATKAGVMLSNTSTDTNYVGRLLRLLEIDWNTADWELQTGTTGSAEQVWVYKNKLEAGQSTTALFNTVKIRESFTAAELAATPGLSWDAEFAWLASISMNHTDACYAYGTHNAAQCTVTYRHHGKCAINDGINSAAAIAATAGGAVCGSKTCDCTPVQVHTGNAAGYTCPYNIGTISCANPAHAATGIDGFRIAVKGAVVQAGVDGMTAYNAAATKTALDGLFTANPYVA